MSVIYTPKGKAREYSPKALNLYMGCSHECKYCYAPNCIRKDKNDYFCIPAPRKNIVQQLEKQLQSEKINSQVMLSFVGDCYCDSTDDNQVTRDVLKVLLKNKVPVSILTKNPRKALRDIDIIKKFGKHIQVGTTLTFIKNKDSREWEPGAPLPKNRVDAMQEIHNNGVKTFASFEPVIIPEQSLSLMRYTSKYNIIDVYKIGKLNNYYGLDKKIDWESFLCQAVEIMRENNNCFYIKKDLAYYDKKSILNEKEIESDYYNVH